MTIIVFLIDTSASMYERTYLGGCPTFLDVAKGAVETFVKVRQRSPESRGDRYMLLSFEDPPFHIKAGWKENLATFMNELKNLRCDGLTTMGPALKQTFDVLNINRMQTGIDTYGQGRCPFFLEPSVIIVITDGGKLTNATGVQEDLTLPMNSLIPGSELTREPFRWDQRLFSLVLRLPGTPALERDVGLVPSDASPIDAMCEVTGGRSYCITSHRMLMQCIDSLVQKVQSGVVINFEKIGPDPPVIEGRSESEIDGDMDSKDWDRLSGGNQGNGLKSNQDGVNSPCALKDAQLSLSNSNNPWHSCRRLIYVPRSAQKGFAVGFWPIPENFWPDVNSPQLPARTAHPNVKFSCNSQEPMVIENLPFDKYELEPSPLTQFILARKQPTVCWQVFVSNSYKNSEVGHPFGYLKASTNLSCVNLFVMPYNYPVLLPLLEELFKVHRQKPTNEWRILFQSYLRTMPPYYASPLRRALTRMGVQGNLSQTLVPDTLDNSLSYSVSNYLKRLKNQAKVDFDRMCGEVGNKNAVVKTPVEGVRVVPRSPLKKELISHPCLQEKFVGFREQLSEYGGFTVGIPSVQCKKERQSYLCVQDIPRCALAEHLAKLKAAFFQGNLRLFHEDGKHSLPVSQMGNYQEHLKRQPAQLREIESAPLRQHMFGNPFKIDKRMMVDEADIDVSGGTSSTSHRSGSKRSAPSSDPSSPQQPSKRKPGPIPKDTVIRRPSFSSPSPSPPPSPAAATAPLEPAQFMPAAAWNASSGAGAGAEDEAPPALNGPADATGNHADPAEKYYDSPWAPLYSNHVGGGGVETAFEPYPLYAGEGEVGAAAVFRPETPEPDGDRVVLTEINGNSGKVAPAAVAAAAAAAAAAVASQKAERVEAYDAAQAAQAEAEVVAHNQLVWRALCREVRRPGRNYSALFVALKTARGSVVVRKAMAMRAATEAMRFKRRILADLLEAFVFDDSV